MPRICRPALALPPYQLTTDELTEILPRIFRGCPIPEPVLLRMASRSGVTRRFLARPLAETLDGTGLGSRSREYARHALRLGREAAEGALANAALMGEEIDLVITVSCTGYMLPSLDARLAPELGLRSDVRRLPITELGCVAGASALSHAADYLRAYAGARVLVVAVELPSLTFQPSDPSPDNLVSALIFGDGAAAVVLDGSAEGGGCEVLDSASLLAPDTLDEMGFDLRDGGFWVVLSGAVPDLVGKAVEQLVAPLLRRNGLTRDVLGFYCVHPGGPKILRAVGGSLAIGERLQHSWDVLRDYGNLSSASILFVLERLYRHPPQPGALGLLLSFGPGLSLEAILLRWR